MPAGGNDCDCNCGSSTCTKWMLGKLQNEIAMRLNLSQNNGNGPVADHLYDASNCRHFLEFGYDPTSKTLVIRSQRAPHRDCVDRTIYGGHEFEYPPETCGTATYTDDGTTIELTEDACCPGYTATPPSGPPVGTPSTPVVSAVPCNRDTLGACRGRLNVVDTYSRPMAAKQIKLKAGWRVRVRLVTDSLIGPNNAFEGDYACSGYWQPQWNDAAWFPLAGVMPTTGNQWTMKKACQFWHGKNVNQYFDSWPYDDIPEVPAIGSFNPSEGYREYEHRIPQPDATMCVLDNGGSTTDPPTDHPTAPLVDQRPAIYGNLITAIQVRAMFDPLYDGATPKPPGGFATDLGYGKKYITIGAATGFPMLATSGNQEDWWLSQFYRWPFAKIMQRSDFVAGGTGDSQWRRSFMSNTPYFQAQPEAGSGLTAVTEPPYKLFFVSVPPISRGYEWTYSSPGVISSQPFMLRPTTPIDTARVAWELEQFEGLFSNLTVHEYSPPEFPDDGTVRPRVVATPGGSIPYTISWIIGDPAALPQTGCVPPGVSDCEIEVVIPKNGTYTLFFEENSTRATAHGATTVVTYNIERPVEGGGWEAVDLIDVCRPSPTPDHTGFVWYNGIEFYSPFKSMGSAEFPNPYRLITRDTRDCPPTGPNLHYIGNPLVDGLWPTIAAYNTLASRFAGATYTNHFNSYDTTTQTKGPDLIFDQYRNRTTGSYCCGYEAAWYPYVGSSCHKDRNLFDNFYTNASGVLDLKASSGGNVTPSARAWSLPW